MKLGFLAALAAAAFVSFAPAALEQAAAAPPQVQIVGPNDLIQIIPNGAPVVGNVYASAIQMVGFANAQPTTVSALIGGDAGTNLFQRATTGASVTTTVTYGGPDRWAYWSGTATAMTVSKDTTAADLPASGYTAAFKMARTSGQTGVIQTCMAQEVETANAVQFQGQNAEFDFHADAGANFSAASSNITAYIITGTGTDEGMQKLAWGLNAGGGGSTAWAGQANATAAVIPISTTGARYAAVAAIPTTATEIGVALCFTPVGTAGTNDYVAFAGIQLVRNPSLTANTTAGYVCGTTVGTTSCTAYDRRPVGFEYLLQQRYYYQVTESATAIQARAICIMSTTSIANCLIRFPVSMRIAPTMTYATGFEASATTASTSATACTGLTTTATLTGNAASPDGVIMDCASTTGFGAAGTGGFLWDVGTGSPTGAIKASAEF
jgi:hypothetical protein